MKQATHTGLRHIPSIDGFVRRDGLRGWPRPLLLRVARAFLDEVRQQVLEGRLDDGGVDALFAGTPSPAEHEVAARCAAASAMHHRKVLNATGVVLHTGIGRAPLCAAAVEALHLAARYAIVEVDPASGQRNQRETATAALLRELTGAPAALVVNNNAAATNLMLAALARGREVVASRGELVEIGGGFRMPDVMAEAGCRMVEVGTTNRTHLRDYEAAIGPDTALLLKVHPSNFRLLGFVGTPPLAELAELAGRHRVLSAFDLGSGLLLESALPGLDDEPRVIDSLRSGVDVLCFSGDKLLGGPQCGILLGRADLIAAIRAHPLYRAFRCDKLTLAALEATLRVYRDGDPLAEIPTLRLLATPADELRALAEDLAATLRRHRPRVVASESFAGSGANPAVPLPSWAVALPGGEPVCSALRTGPGTPVFARIADDAVLLDLRTLQLEEPSEVAAAVEEKLTGG